MKRPAAEPAGTSPALKRPAAAEPAAPIADLKPPADAVPAAPVLKRPAAAEPAAPFACPGLPTEQELLHEAAYMCIDPVGKTKPEPAKWFNMLQCKIHMWQLRYPDGRSIIQVFLPLFKDRKQILKCK